MPVSDSCNSYNRARTTSQTGAFPSRIPTLTEPTGDGVILVGEGSFVARQVVFVPFGAGADNSTFDVRLIGWKQVVVQGSQTGATIWVPVVLAQFAVTLSALVGVASGALINTDRFGDTMTLTAPYATEGVDAITRSPANDVSPAHAMVDLKGCRKLEFTFNLGTATNANAVYQVL